MNRQKLTSSLLGMALAGVCVAPVALFTSSVLASTDGLLDNMLDNNTFGDQGRRTTIIGNSYNEGRSVAVQADGKIIVAGSATSTGSNSDFAVVRFTADGQYDNTFGPLLNGMLSTDIGANSDDLAQAVAVQSDGKIIVAGYSTSTGSDSDFAVVRYNTNGSLDTSFDTDGKVTTDIGSNSYDYGYGIAIQADGKIVVAGHSESGASQDDFVVVRYNTNGSLDTSFDTDGKVTTDFGTNKTDYGYEIVLQADGKIVVAGISNSGASWDFAVTRYNTNGSLDTSFDTDGKVTTDIGTNSTDYGSMIGIAMQADGKIVVACGDGFDFAVVRYNTNGSLDTSFDTDGKVTTDFGTNKYDIANTVLTLPDGKIIVAGYSLAGGTNDFAVVRYNSDGSLDTSFGTAGKTITDIDSSSDDYGNAVVVQPSGKIVVAGTSGSGGFYKIAVARYSGTPVTAPTTTTTVAVTTTTIAVTTTTVAATSTTATTTPTTIAAVSTTSSGTPLSASLIRSFSVRNIVMSNNLLPGSSASIRATGFTPDETVSVGVLESAASLTTTIADSNGRVSTEVSIPSSAKGKVTVFAYGQTSSRGYKEIVPVSSKEILPATGTQTSTSILTLIGSLCAMGGLIVASRRRVFR